MCAARVCFACVLRVCSACAPRVCCVCVCTSNCYLYSLSSGIGDVAISALSENKRISNSVMKGFRVNHGSSNMPVGLCPKKGFPNLKDGADCFIFNGF